MTNLVRFLAVAFLATAATAGAQGAAKSSMAAPKPAAKAKYKKDLPAKLTRTAKVTEAAAAATALAQVPNGKIESVELEEEDGKLLYSYDIKAAGKSGIEEVHVDAMTGAILSNVHETPADEKTEAANDAKQKKATTKKAEPAKTKKPPV